MSKLKFRSAICFAVTFQACSVCFGDSESLMVKGAVVGAYFLVGVIGFVMLSIVGTTLFWAHRSRQLAASCGEGGLRDS